MRRQEWRNHTRKRRELQKKGPGQKSDTEAEAVGGEVGPSQEEAIQEGTYDQHLSH